MKIIKVIPVFVAMTLALSNNAKAQYVICDDGFVTWLNLHAPLGLCLYGNQLDTTCPALLNVHKVSITNNLNHGYIPNLNIVHFLRNLDTLIVYGNGVDEYDGLDDLTTLPLPIHLKYLSILSTAMQQLPPLSDSLLILNCSYAKLSHLPNVLPQNLTELRCSNNLLTQLSGLPNSLTTLECDNNLLSSLPPLPSNLILLHCGNNFQIIPPSVLPGSLREFVCNFNGWTTLPSLPNSLQTLTCDNNQLSLLPPLPTSLQTLTCPVNQLSLLPRLSDSLTFLSCEQNLLLSLPSLPNSLQYLSCNYNQLSTLPSFPSSLKNIYCRHNQITSLPELPDTMVYLDCSYNPDLRCLPELKTMQCGSSGGCGNVHPNNCLNFVGTAVSCIPNLGNGVQFTPSVPLCNSVNPVNCISYSSIKETRSIPFNLFPNPCNDLVTIRLDEMKVNTTLELLDVTGKEIESHSFQTSTMNLETYNLSAGIYLLKLSNTRGETAISKLVKQ